jgi:hypothetical protein
MDSPEGRQAAGAEVVTIWMRVSLFDEGLKLELEELLGDYIKLLFNSLWWTVL